MRPAGFLLGLACLCGCSTATILGGTQTARFPIGIYDVDEPKLLPALREIGFNSIETGDPNPVFLGALAGEAHKQGMRILAFPDKLRQADASAVKDWPVEAWYLQDEPDVHGTPAAALEEISKKTRAWDGVRSQAFVIGQGSAAANYGHVGDVVMLDWYPVPHLALDSVAVHVDLALSRMPPGKPLWMIIQAFDWRNFRQCDPKKERIGRFPSRAEIRFMTYISIVHGARGIFYYTLRKPEGKTLFDAPGDFDGVVRVVRELKELHPVLERGSRIPVPFKIDAGKLEAAAWRHRSRTYVVVLNRDKDIPLRLPEPLLDARWRLMFETGGTAQEVLTESGGAWLVPPHRVLVFAERRSDP